MLFTDTYKTITGISTAIYREKASKFMAFAYAVTTEEDVKEVLKSLKKEYFDANHHCYAYQLGIDKSASRMNDDGEPSGTAGRPIFGQIQSFDLTNILIVVIRYFGGTKLGVSGLINAYKTAAKDALSSAQIIEKIVSDYYSVEFSYNHMNDVMKFMKDKQLTIVSTDFNLDCSLIFGVRRGDSEIICNDLKKKEGIIVKYIKTE